MRDVLRACAFIGVEIFLTVDEFHGDRTAADFEGDYTGFIAVIFIPFHVDSTNRA